MKNTEKQVGLLGGTFNPPHLGHLYIAKTVYEEFNLDKVLFIPVGDPPHKTDKYIAASEHRINMIKIMISQFSYLDVLTIETERNGYTYTVDTLTELNNKYPNINFYYIIGSDTLFNLKTWKNFKKVFELTSFICISRPGDAIEDINNEINFLKNTYSAKILLSEYCGPDISSTNVRSDIKKINDSDLIEKNVMEYIVDNNVFR